MPLKWYVVIGCYQESLIRFDYLFIFDFIN